MTEQSNNTDRTEPNYQHVSFIIRSQYRTESAMALADRPSTPSEVAEESDHEVAHVSRAIGELESRGLAELLVSEDTKRGRIYGLTDEGQAVVDDVKERGST